MKILHTVEFYYPSIGGTQEVIRHLSERMVRMGHDVTVATTKLANRESLTHNGVKIAEFEVSGNAVRGIKGEKKRYQEFLKKSEFDIILNYAAQQWTADAFFEVMDEVKGKKVLVPCGYSAIRDEQYKSYFEKLPDILKKYDATVYLANDYQDTNFGRELGLKNMVLIPNGADEVEFGEPLSEERKRFLRTKYAIGGHKIITIGLYGEKGHMELLRAFKRLPVTNATFISVGSIRPHEGCYDEFERQADRVNNSRKFVGKRVVMVDGSLREEIHDLLKLSDVFAFFSNIECSPLVLFEAAAAGVPFLATDVGNSREIAEWTSGGVIAKTHKKENSRVAVDDKDAVLQLTKLLYNKGLRKKLGETGRENWKKHYTWDLLTKKYVALYEDLIAGKKLEDTLS